MSDRAARAKWAERIRRNKEAEERFGPQIDTAYEEDLQACRDEGHAQSVEVCSRCGEDFGLMEAEL